MRYVKKKEFLDKHLSNYLIWFLENNTKYCHAIWSESKIGKGLPNTYIKIKMKKPNLKKLNLSI